MKELLPNVVQIALASGEAIMRIYRSGDFAVQHKEDCSPVTLADKTSHEVIMEGLGSLNKLDILSEEGRKFSWQTRRSWSRYWLIDPLDGTKEFIKRNDEFTVNIALVEHGVSVLGVVLAPAKGCLYFGSPDLGAFKCHSITERTPDNIDTLLKQSIKIQVAKLPDADTCWRVAGSRSHQDEEFNAFTRQLQKTRIVPMGSSLKLCLVAEGVIDLYPRLGLTSEWDTAAAQAIVESAGGLVLDMKTGKPLIYNQKNSLLNPFFIACASRSPQWNL